MFTPDTPIEYLRLTPRTYWALLRNGIEIIEQLTKLSSGQVRGMRGIGRKGYKEITETLEKEGLKLPTFPTN